MWNVDIKLNEYDSEKVNNLIKLLMNNIIIEYISIDNIKKTTRHDTEYLYLKSKLNSVYVKLINKLKKYYRKKLKKIRNKMMKLANINNMDFIKMKVYYDMLYNCMNNETKQLIQLKKKNIEKLFNECVNEKIVNKIKLLNKTLGNKIKDFHIVQYKLNVEKYNNIDNYINHIKNIWNI